MKTQQIMQTRSVYLQQYLEQKTQKAGGTFIVKNTNFDYTDQYSHF